MGADVMPFADNWAYLKTELAWLDRLLMLAVSRQRKDEKNLNQIAKTPADRVSEHWWKGVISVPRPAYDDSRVVPSKRACKPAVGYQSQLESRIQRTAKDGIVLALPSLRQYLNLTLFEKNLLLMVLAPEVHRRYGKLYRFLQTGKEDSNPTASDLPMVDLALRLLCRNELERRKARAKLAGPDSLLERRILRYAVPRSSTRLSSYLQLTDEWVDYLLAEQPDQQFFFKQLETPKEPMLALPAPTVTSRAVKIYQPEVSWDKLILPAPLLSQLQALGQQASAGLLTDQALSQVALLVGERGTGKKMAAGAIATSMRQPLCELDLAQVHPRDWAAVLDTLDADRYPVLLVRAASVWFGRQGIETANHEGLSKAKLSQWLQSRRSQAGLTLLSTRYLHLVQARWRQRMDAILTLPLPYKAARTMMWRQAFSGITCSTKIDWATLAAQLKVTGGEITAIAQEAIAIAQSKNAKSITFSHIQQATKQRGLSAVLNSKG
ncbi:MAG: AAA family ATPase [Cyanobacteria bacterium J06632_3]